jgi:nucleotidyltransferase substrate binding protein (TIGR01987 family)
VTADDLLRRRLDTLAAALGRLESALSQPKTEWTRDSAIQRFEFTFELAWKAVVAAARAEGLEVVSPRDAVRTARRLGWIDDDQRWLDMLDARNRTSHTYSEDTADSIYSGLPAHAQALRELWRVLVNTRARPEPERPERQSPGHAAPAPRPEPGGAAPKT